LRARPAPLSGPHSAALLSAAVPALMLTLLSFAQVRWLGVADALWLGALVVAAKVFLESEHAFLRAGGARAASAGLAAAVFLLPVALAPSRPLPQADNRQL